MTALAETSAPDALTSVGERLDRRQLAILGAILAVGAGLRIWMAAIHDGVSYDVQTVAIVGRAFAAHPLHVYSTLRYLYPGGYLPVFGVSHWIAHATGANIVQVFKVPAIAADLAMVGLIAWGLGRLGATPRDRLVAAGLIALSPLFIGTSGVQGQLDAPSVLPALIAIVIWRCGGAGRAWKAGLLVGLGAAIKPLPLFMVLAMLPTALDRKEAGALVACALSVPLASVAPFLIVDWHHVTKALTLNKGFPGLGGLSVVIQPSIVHGWLFGGTPRLSGASSFIWHEQNVIVGVAVLLVGAFAYRRRIDAVTAAALIWLVVYVANPNWNYNYFVWGLPFFLLAGRWREVAGLTVLLSLAGADLFHIALSRDQWLYIALMMLAWTSIAIATFLTARKIVAARRTAAAPPRAA